MTIENVGPGGVRRSGGVRTPTPLQFKKDVAGAGNGIIYDENGNEIDAGDLPIGREIFTSSTTENSILDDNNRQLISNSSSNATYTLVAGTCQNGVAVLMRGTGLVTISAGVGVTFITSQNQTFTRGDVIYAIPTGVVNEFLVKVA